MKPLKVSILVAVHKDVEKLERDRRLKRAAKRHARISWDVRSRSEISYEAGGRWMYRYLKKGGLLK